MRLQAFVGVRSFSASLGRSQNNVNPLANILEQCWNEISLFLWSSREKKYFKISFLLFLQTVSKHYKRSDCRVMVQSAGRNCLKKTKLFVYVLKEAVNSHQNMIDVSFLYLGSALAHTSLWLWRWWVFLKLWTVEIFFGSTRVQTKISYKVNVFVCCLKTSLRWRGWQLDVRQSWFFFSSLSRQLSTCADVSPSLDRKSVV